MSDFQPEQLALRKQIERPGGARRRGFNHSGTSRQHPDGEPQGCDYDCTMKKVKSKKLDVVTLTVINNALVNICREMGTAMMRTSYSPIFNEALDFSCVIFTPRGEMIGQAEFCPTMIGSAQYAVKWTIEELGPGLCSSPAMLSYTTILIAGSAICRSIWS